MVPRVGAEDRLGDTGNLRQAVDVKALQLVEAFMDVGRAPGEGYALDLKVFGFEGELLPGVFGPIPFHSGEHAG